MRAVFCAIASLALTACSQHVDLDRLAAASTPEAPTAPPAQLMGAPEQQTAALDWRIDVTQLSDELTARASRPAMAKQPALAAARPAVSPIRRDQEAQPVVVASAAPVVALEPAVAPQARRPTLRHWLFGGLGRLRRFFARAAFHGGPVRALAAASTTPPRPAGE